MARNLLSFPPLWFFLSLRFSFPARFLRKSTYLPKPLYFFCPFSKLPQSIFLYFLSGSNLVRMNVLFLWNRVFLFLTTSAYLFPSIPLLETYPLFFYAVVRSHLTQFLFPLVMSGLSAPLSFSCSFFPHLNHLSRGRSLFPSSSFVFFSVVSSEFSPFSSTPGTLSKWHSAPPCAPSVLNLGVRSLR